MYSSDRFAIVISQFNSEVTEKLYEGAYAELLRSGVSSEHVRVFRVPGAIEIPITAQRCAKTRQFSAIIALGAVIRGETSHYDVVCQQVSYGCQKVALEYSMPIIFGILTTENEAQALDRVGGVHGHKGIESAQAALMLLKTLADIPPCIT